jgi:hypothetical protein
LKKNCVMAESAPALTLSAKCCRSARVALLRVVFGVGGHLDEPVRALRLADEAHQLAGVAEFARRGRAAGQVAAQRHQAADALRAVGGQDLGNAFARAAHAGQVRRGLVAHRGDGLHGGQGLVARGAAGAVGHAEELGLHRRQVLHHGLELFAADRVCWGGRTRS